MDRQTSGKVDGNNNEQKGDCAEKSTYFNAFKSICSAVGRLLKYFSIRTKKKDMLFQNKFQLERTKP